MKKIGILGGSFDPIHNGHIAIAQDAYLQAALDMVFFMPTAQSPLKAHNPLANDIQRYRMIELALQNQPKFDVLDWELVEQGVSYTINTVHMLKKSWPQIRFYWIIGSDLLESLSQWKQINELVELIEFIVVQRPGSVVETPPIPNLKIQRINNPLCNISSSEIRQMVRAGKPIDELVPIEVKNYILINNIYHE